MTSVIEHNHQRNTYVSTYNDVSAAQTPRICHNRSKFLNRLTYVVVATSTVPNETDDDRAH